MMLSPTTRKSLYVHAVVLLVAAAAIRAQSSGFDARRAELRRAAEAAQQAEGLGGDGNRAALFKKYPTPEIGLAKAPLALAPGASGGLSVPGKFPAGTTILAGSDAISLADVVVTAAALKARVSAAAGVPPQWARVYAFAPVSLAESWTPVFVGTPQSFSLQASNGWTVKVTPEARAFTVSEDAARITYKAEYFKSGQATPFETASGALSLDASNRSAGHYTLMLSAGGSAQEEYMALATRQAELMQAGKLDTKEFRDLSAKAEAAQERMMKELDAMMANPAAAQKKRDEFGCETMSLNVEGTRVSGEVSCGSAVGTLRLTGNVL